MRTYRRSAACLTGHGSTARPTHAFRMSTGRYMVTWLHDYRYMAAIGNHEDGAVALAHFSERFRHMPSTSGQVQLKNVEGGTTTNNWYYSWDAGLVHYIARTHARTCARAHVRTCARARTHERTHRCTTSRCRLRSRSASLARKHACAHGRPHECERVYACSRVHACVCARARVRVSARAREHVHART